MLLLSLWRENPQNMAQMTIALSDTSSKNIAAYFAAMFLANHKTFPLLSDNHHFKEAFFKLWGVELMDSNQCISAQKKIFEFLQEKPYIANEMLPFLEKLKEVDELSAELEAYIKELSLSFLKPSSKNNGLNIFEEFDFLSIKERFLDILNLKTEELFESSWLENEWDNAKKNLINTHFSVGVTGVMNAGKSTLLNALMGCELLGTSTIPETANLSIITHSDKPYAKVNFWTKKEWEQIEKSASVNSSMRDFIDETKTLEDKNWKKYITISGETKDIDVKDLAKFTSVKESKGLCNIIKSVEIGSSISFGSKGISIVDTPGLDDPIIQREEITKHYLANCDALVHLMNASQSATQKDVDFIIDALIYQRVAHLVLVITRIDTIDSASLEEVISYTKSSITKRVQSLGKPHLINPVLEKIKVFPVSGYFALMHKIGKKDEAIKSGWDIEKTGFINLEKYLHEILFGGERARIIIKATAKSLLLTLENQIKIYEDEKKLLGQNSQDLHKTRELLIEKQAKSNKTIETIEKNSKSLISACGDYLKTMEQLAGTRLRRLQSELKNRISNDVNYNVKKNQELPKIDRIETIVETTMQDGLMDLVREYRFEFYKHILSMLEPFMRKSNEVLKEIDFIFDPKAYQDEAAKGGVLSTNHKLLAQNLGDCVKSMKPKKINQSMEILNDKIAQGFAPLESRILPLMKETGERVIESLSLAISSPLKLAKNSTEQELANLNRAILYTSKNAKSSQERKESIERKITKLKLLSKQIDMLSKAV